MRKAAVRVITSILFLSVLGLSFTNLFKASANADTIMYGTVGSFSDCTPGCTPQFQQLYSHTLFSTASYITKIELYYLLGDIQTYTFSLSNSPSTIGGGLSNTFTDNIGANNQLFYTGPLIAPDPITHTASYTGVPFYYNPALGDLLLYVHHTGLGNSSSSSYILFPESFTLVRRVYSFDDGSTGFGNQAAGLVTTFETSAAVPEPSTLLLLGSGLAGLGFFRRRKKNNLKDSI